MQPLDPTPSSRSTLLWRYSHRLLQLQDRGQAELAGITGIKLQRSDALMRNIVENSFDGILTLGESGEIGIANASALGIFGVEAKDFEGSLLQSWVPEFLPEHLTENSPLSPWHGHRETKGCRKDGSQVPLEISITEGWHDEARLFIAIIRDVTERREQQRALEYQAMHDSLTGLPNRSLLVDRLEHALAVAQREQKPLALLLIDLDRFKDINDTLGHHVGDLVLREVAHRLAEPIRRTDTIARLGGDEFAVLLPAVSDLARAQRVAQRIAKALEPTFQVVEGLALEVGLSIGIALHPDHASDAAKLLQCADVAMYQSKRSQTRPVVYDQNNDHHSVRHLTLTGALRKAIENDELALFYQPKIDLRRGRIRSVEALVRWDHPEHGQVPPEEFIRHAEQTGLIEPLTQWAFEAAFRVALAWQRDGLDLGMAINLSTRSLHGKQLTTLLTRLLDETALEPGRVTLEITESAIMIDPDSALNVARQISDLGVRLSIDDFGTGYSSLAYLSRLPVNELKIDKSFVIQMTKNYNDSVIVHSTVSLAHNLDLEVVAEGVECEQHAEVLRQLECDLGQGFHFSQALPLEELNDWLETSSLGLASAPEPATS